MAWMKKVTLVSSLALLVSGCNMYKLEELRHTTMTGTPFQNELAKLYMEYASEEERQYDWNDSWYFADKGLSLAYGKDAGPEELGNWTIPASVLPEMEKARASLMAVLTPDLMRASPSRAAAAQFYFDCWVEQQEENWQEEEIAYCRDNLLKSLADLNAPGAQRAVAEPAPKPAKKAVKAQVVKTEESVTEVKTEITKETKVELAHESIDAPLAEEAKEVKAPKEPKPAKVVKESAEPKEIPVPESTSYAVFFETNKAEVSEPGMNVITEIIKSLAGTSDYVVLLHSSKDRPGMAAERIHVIRKLLAAGGIKEKAIKISSGKSEIETGKSVSRRVEIFLNE